MSHLAKLLKEHLSDWSPAQIRRLNREIELMEEKYPEFKLSILQVQNVVFWAGVIEEDNRSQKIAVICESSFPQRSPYVVPLTDDLQVDDLSETYHQNPDMTMCLFVWDRGPNSWHPENISIPEVVGRAKIHFRRTIRGEHVDIHEDWYDPYTRMRCEHTVILPSHLASWFLQASQRFGQLNFGILPGGNTVVITDLHPCGLVSDHWKKVLGDNFVSQEGGWVRDKNTWGNLCSLRDGSISVEEFRKRLSARYNIDGTSPMLLVRSTGDRVSCWFINCPACQNEQSGERRKPLTLVSQIDVEAELYSRIPNDASLKKLQGTTVMLIGCGSLGSAVLHDLVTSGLRNFILVDPDVVMPANVLRHPASLKDIYRKKVECLKEDILSRNPLCSVSSYPFDLFVEWFHKLRNDLAQRTDLIISTVAHSSVDQLVNGYGIANRKSIVFASVLGTGLGGRIFRVIPGETPCYKCCAVLQDLNSRWYRRYTSEIDEALPAQDGVNYRTPAVPGLARDIEAVAGITGRLAIQTLLESLDEEVPIYSKLDNHLLWSNRAGWIFGRSFQLIEESYPRYLSCPACGPQSFDPLDRSEVEKLRDAFRRNDRKPTPWKAIQ